jgi:hypothetical protein
MKFKCPYCGTTMGCIECSGFLCDGCGTDLSSLLAEPVCELCRYRPEDNDNDTEEIWDD